MFNSITLDAMLRIEYRGQEWKGTIGGKLDSSFNNSGDRKWWRGPQW